MLKRYISPLVVKLFEFMQQEFYPIKFCLRDMTYENNPWFIFISLHLVSTRKNDNED